VFWDRMTSAALGRADRAVPVLLPLGATEQHGPHLPVCTDRLLGETLAAAAEARLPDGVLVCPSVQVGCSDHHLPFPGTLSARHETFAGYVSDLLASVVSHGFRAAVLFNAHGGNQAIGTVVLEQFGYAHPEVRVVFTSWWQLAAPELLQLSTTGPGGVGHACELETSMMLATAPELVDVDAIPGMSGQPAFAWSAADMLRSGRTRIYQRQDQVAANGVHGNPSAASADKGHRAISLVTNQLVTVLTDIGPRAAVCKPG
jgi:creatinine amidohydrolase